MRRIGGPSVAVLALCAVLTVSGCTAPRVCAEAESGPPGIVLDATAWIHDHRGQPLTACLAARCAQLTAENPATSLQAPAPDTSGTYRLTVTTAGTVVADEPLHLADPTASGPCGPQAVAMTRRLALDGRGHISDVLPLKPVPSPSGNAAH